MSENIRASILVLLQFLWLQSFSQEVTNLQHYSTADGLSDNRITDITKDSEGFMWFGSWAGISRFDGYKFLTFKSYPGDRSSLKSNRIDEIVEDSHHQHLWIRAYDKQVYRFDKQTQQFTSLADLLGQEQVKKMSFSKIMAVRENIVWLKTEDQGVLLISNSAAAKPGFTVFSSSRAGAFRLRSNKLNFFFLDQLNNAWIGTSKGLVFARKGGYSYRLENWPQLSTMPMSEIAYSKNSICVVSEKGELLKVDYRLKTIMWRKPFATTIHHMRFGKWSDTLYCTTDKGELLAVDKFGKVRELLHTPNRSPLYYIFADRAGVFWIESKNYGVVRFDTRSGPAQYLFSVKDYPFNPKQRNFTVFEDKSGNVWFNLFGKLSFYNNTTRKMEPLSMTSFYSGRSVPKNVVRTFYDPAGVLWVGTGLEGIDKLLFKEHQFKQVTPYPQNDEVFKNEVRGILVDHKNRIWIGTKDRELLIYHNNQRVGVSFNKKMVNSIGIYSMLEDRNGRIWLGTKADGLIRATPENASQTQYAVEQYFGAEPSASGLNSRSVYALLQDHKGRIWVGTYENGLVLVDEKEGKTSFKTIGNCFKNYPKGGFLKIRHLKEDAKGNIWVATTAGLLVFNPDKGASKQVIFKQYKKEPGNIHSLGGNDIQFIHLDSRQRIWLLTTTGGLNLAVGNDPLENLSFINYSTKQGLPSDFLLSCVEDTHRNLWIATQNGISRFSIDKRKFQNFNHNDGLQEAGFSEASCAKLRSGELIFGNAEGFMLFDPLKVHVQKITAPLAFTNLQINSEDVVPGENAPLKYSVNSTDVVKLEYDQNVVSVDFAVLDYHATDKLAYACRLTGFDNVWRSTEGQRRATYTKLPPGDYVFEVKCLNDELYKQIPSRSLRITILPPPWKTWWAYCIYLAIIGLSLVAVRRVAITMFKLRQGIEVERQLADLKLSFFTQVSHELRTPLTLIINPAEEILENEALSGKGKDYINVVVKNARRMLRMVNQVLDLRKVQSGKASLQLVDVELIAFVKDLLIYFSETVSQNRIQIEISSAVQQQWIRADVEKLEIIIFNILANALKFSPSGGLIKIQINQSGVPDTLKLEIADEGPGVAQEELNDIFQLYYEGKPASAKQSKGTGIGLALSRELVELHGGKIYAEHNQPGGLKIILELKQETRLQYTNKPDLAAYVPEEASAIPLTEDSGTAVQKESELPIVLIVEDNNDLRKFLATKFAGLYQVYTAENGRVALERIKETMPDLVLSDIMMPEMDGIELLDHLKHNEQTSHIPVILLTAKQAVESQVAALQYGADYYITKPFEMKLLQAAVSNIISKRKSFFNAVQNNEDKSEEIQERPITEQDRRFLERILAVVEEKLDDQQFNIDDVADSLNMSRSTFYRKFRSLTNLTPVEFVRDIRLKKAKALFDEGQENIATAAYAVGFNNPKYFSSCFKAQYEQSPSEYVKKLKSSKKKV